MSEELPEGWEETELGMLTEGFQYGTSVKADSEPSGGIPILRMGNIQDGHLSLEDLKYVPQTEELRAFRLLRGDVLFNRTNSPELVGKSAVFDIDSEMVFASYLVRFRPIAGAADPRFICSWLNSSWGRDWAASVRTDGVSQSNINATKLAEMKIPLPPFPEQRRIVAKVEELLSRTNAARERLSRVPVLLKRFRQAVLAAACSGRLTEEWRDRNEQSSFQNTKPESSRYSPRYDFRSVTKIPDGWSFDALGNLGSWTTGGTPSKDRAEYWNAGSIPWVSPKDMKSDVISGSLDLITPHALEETRLKLLPPGSLLFVVRGMILAHTFPVGLTSREVTFNQDIRALLPEPGHDPKYLLYALKNEAWRILFAVKEATHGTLRIESDLLLNWPVPLPSLPEQHEIVRRIEAMFALANTIEARLKATLAWVEKLPQAVLSKAFRGELVPTEAELARTEGRSYESAEELLERVKNWKSQEQKSPARAGKYRVRGTRMENRSDD